MAKHRSPAYPQADLPTAIGQLEQLYPQGTKHALGAETVAKEWGYKSISSASPYIAAGKQYGLLEEIHSEGDRMLRITDRGKDIASDRDGNTTERRNAIRDAAIAPKIFREMWDRWGDALPPESEMRRYLERDREFNPRHVAKVVVHYKDTLKFAKLTGKDTNGELPGEKNNTSREVDTSDNGNDPENSRGEIKVGSFVQWTSNGVNQFPAVKQIVKIEKHTDGAEYAGFEEEGGYAPMSELTIEEPAAGIKLLKPSSNPPPPPEDRTPEGTAVERWTFDEGPVRIEMPGDLSSDSVEEFEYKVTGLIQQLRRKAGGEHVTHKLDSGEFVHLVSHPGSDKWQIKSFDRSWLAADHSQLITATAYAEKNGWQDLKFDSPEEATDFVRRALAVPSS